MCQRLAIHNSCSVDVVYTNFSKAVDSVCHTKLIRKLESLGIGSNLLFWMNDYSFVQRMQWNEAMKEMNSATGLQSNHTSADESPETPDDDDKDGFFSFERVDRGSWQTNLNSELDMFLNDNSREVTSVAACSAIKALFLKYNTGLPSSAPAEHRGPDNDTKKKSADRRSF